MSTEQITYNTEAEYESAMDEIYELMNRGEANLTEAEKDKVRDMALAAEAYEDKHFPFPPPETIPEMVERKRFELNLTQAGLAEMLGLGKTKLSQILNGKQEPDVPFLKAVYQKLGIDPGLLLDNA
ncbi:helix-turn-helix domain-containing protein [Dyadobacter sp. OTU695]|uniref:helix-turn-helix domain-containing protein n=1 Tax=Dyadobacter sp. OTU695 TaxID=3043860 RepID=UPI00313D2ECB